ncbi:TPA: hypothetical protein NOU44_000249 [Salmonella enterica subsp. enterica serovar Infantis]|nr:hypothetical protein [Salmonella enterica subsp. enterica serovar Infantis]
MSKSWDEVVNSAAFSSLSPAQREQARQQYFNEQVAPHVPEEKLPDVERQFYSTTQLYPKQSDATTFISSAFGEVAQMGNNAMHFAHMESDSDYDKNNQVIRQHFNQDEDNAPVISTAGKLAGGSAVIIPAAELGAATGAGLVETAGLSEVPGVTWAAQGLGSSVASQIPASGKVTLKQTGIDMLTHGVLSAPSVLANRSRALQTSKIFDKMSNYNPIDTKGMEAADEYLAASRAHDVAKDYEKQKRIAGNEGFTLEDALNNLDKQSPGLSSEDYQAVEDVFAPFNYSDVPEVRMFTNPNINPEELLEHTESIKSGLKQKVDNLAESGKAAGKVIRTAENNRAYGKGWLKGRMTIDNDIVEPTIYQRAGELVSDWLGFDSALTGTVKGKVGRDLIKDDSEQLIKDLKKDNNRIDAQRESISGKKGTHYTSQRYALNYQQQANNQMINFLENGLKGKKYKVNDFNILLKESQEKSFSTPNLAKRFRNLTERYEQAGLIEAEDSVNKLVKEVAKMIGHHSLSAIGGFGTAGAVPAVAYLLGRMAKASKSEAMESALKYYEDMQEEKASYLDIKEHLDQKAKEIKDTPFARLTTSALSTYNNKDDKK